MQSRLDKFWRHADDYHPPSDSDSEGDYVLEEKQQTDQWTRVATFEEMAKPKVRTYNLAADMKRGYDFSNLRFHLHDATDLLVFDPEAYKGRDNLLTIEAQKLEDDDLLAFGELATRLRRQFNDSAIRQVTGNQDIIENLNEQYHEIPEHLQRKLLRPKKGPQLEEAIEGFDDPVRVNRRTQRRDCQLTMEERSAIMEAVSGRRHTHRALSDKYWVKINVIKRMARDAKKGRPMLQRRIRKHDEKIAKISAIATVIDTIKGSRKSIDNTDQIREQVLARH